MYDNPNEETWCSLPGWRLIPDPEIAGSSVWVHDGYDGSPDIAVLVSEETYPVGHPMSISVLANPMITPAEIDGECVGTFATWDAALEGALAYLEIKE